MERLLIRWFIRDSERLENPEVRTAYGYLGAGFGIVTNLFLFGVKFVIGTLMNSIAVTADAFNNLSDVASSGVTFLSFRVSSKPADAEHPFGHGRLEYLSTLVVATMILLVGYELGKASIEKILNPVVISTSPLMLGVLCLSVGVKLYQSIFNKSIGTKIKSGVLLATATDSLNDCISTIVVILSVVLGYFLPFSIDGYMGVVVALFILKAGYGIMVETIDPLLGAPATKEFVEEIEAAIMEFPEVVGTHDLIIHDYGPGRKIVSIHAELPDSYDFLTAHEISDTIERVASKKLGIFLTVHIDPVSSDTPEMIVVREVIQEILHAGDKNLTYHDLRMVKGERTINIIVDIVVAGLYFEKANQKELVKTLYLALVKLDPRYHLIVEFDLPYYGTGE